MQRDSHVLIDSNSEEPPEKRVVHVQVSPLGAGITAAVVAIAAFGPIVILYWRWALGW